MKREHFRAHKQFVSSFDALSIKYCNTTGQKIYKQLFFRYLTDSLSLLESFGSWYLPRK